MAVVEVTLRLTGFSYVLYPEDIEFGRPDPVLLKSVFREDDELFWVSRDYPERLERLGAERPRLVFLGDSCTQLGRYDRELARLVAERGGAELAYGNLGVAGWSSFQGRRQLERDVLPLTPAVVTLYYGWNDHWVGFGIEDKSVARVKAVFSSGWSRLRLVQLVTQATVAVGTLRSAYPERVSRDDFVANLRAMVRTSRHRGVRPVLVTAASGHVRGAEPEHLGERFLRDLGELVPLHRSYVAAVREAAAAEGADLCDPAAALEELPRERAAALFRSDGIHLTEAGDRWLAQVLDGCFEERGLWPAVLD